jgi:basic amino acid/polyamine antiporter, APA family
MASGLVAATGLVVLVLVAIDRSMGFEFYMRANAAYWTGRAQEAAGAAPMPAMPVWPNPALLALMGVGSPLLRLLVVLSMSAWFFGWAGTIYLSSTRILFSAAFDRLLPGHIGDLDPRSKSPVKALLCMIVPGLLVSALYVWNIFNFASLTLVSTLVIAVTYLGTGVAAILLPFVQKELYRASPLAHLRLGRLPLISLFGLLFCLFLGYLLFEWMVDPGDLYGVSLRNATSVAFMLVVYAAAAILYAVLRSRGRRAAKASPTDPA